LPDVLGVLHRFFPLAVHADDRTLRQAECVSLSFGGSESAAAVRLMPPRLYPLRIDATRLGIVCRQPTDRQQAHRVLPVCRTLTQVAQGTAQPPPSAYQIARFCRFGIFQQRAFKYGRFFPVDSRPTPGARTPPTGHPASSRRPRWIVCSAGPVICATLRTRMPSTVELASSIRSPLLCF
jgi:hypothetical protein